VKENESEESLRSLPKISAFQTLVLCLFHEIQPIPMPSQASTVKMRREEREREEKRRKWKCRLLFWWRPIMYVWGEERKI
jgi:hypothetical protein